MTTPFRIGQRVQLRLDYGVTVDATVIRPKRWRSLVSWGVLRRNGFGDEPRRKTVTAWRWNHRMWDQDVIDRIQRDEAQAAQSMRRITGNPAMPCAMTVCCLGDGHDGEHQQ